jgi:hypothetical protein
MLDAAPETFHKDIIQCPAASVHADCDVMQLQNASKSVTGELAALVSIENIRRAVSPYRLF